MTYRSQSILTHSRPISSGSGDCGADAGLAARLDFTTAVKAGGYVWWYLDAISDDGASGLTIIAFIGSVFSPYYARARRLGRGDDPSDHIALNVALYGEGGKRWSMTERGKGALRRDRQTLEIGPSRLKVDGDDLVIRIEEMAVPFPRRLRGEVRIRPIAQTDEVFALDQAGHHRWRPIAPHCSVEVRMEKPERSWQGSGYLDGNQGDEPLEDGFVSWDWSRARLGDETAILYDALRRDQSRLSLGLLVDDQGRVREVQPPARQSLPANSWRVDRVTQTSGKARLVETLEDTPFYSRSLIETELFGQSATAMHESLSLNRFRQRWVQTLLPFRMPRVV